jgi:hypothetical protein
MPTAMGTRRAALKLSRVPAAHTIATTAMNMAMSRNQVLRLFEDCSARKETAIEIRN